MIGLPGNKVGVIPMRDPDQIGKIWVPDTAKDRTDQGIVKYVGPECQYAKVGMYVTFSGYTGTLLHIEDQDTGKKDEIIIMPEDFIFAEFVDFPTTDIPGLYFRGANGEYFTATYEMAMHFIALAFKEAAWRQWNPVNKTGINVITQKPTPEEYAKLRGG